jgi:hypothetical protein
MRCVPDKFRLLCGPYMPPPPLSGSGLLVDTDLARAVGSENEATLAYWWGVSDSTVRRWRAVRGLETQAGADGSRRLIQAVAEKGVAEMAAGLFTDRERHAPWR